MLPTRKKKKKKKPREKNRGKDESSVWLSTKKIDDWEFVLQVMFVEFQVVSAVIFVFAMIPFSEDRIKTQNSN